jgi:hypothetical protein
MKLLEQQYSIVTQHVSSKTMVKAIKGDGGAGMVLDNILMKTNLKMGGLCRACHAGGDAAHEPRHPKGYLVGFLVLIDILLSFSERWLSRDRMFIGLDVCHPPKQPVHERRLGIPPQEPSVVGVRAFFYFIFLFSRCATARESTRSTLVERTGTRSRVARRS